MRKSMPMPEINSGEPFICLRNACYTYPNNSFSLDDINAEISGQGLTLICGGNGSGKSTLCKLIIGLLKPQSGSLLIGGCDASRLNLAQRGRLIGYLFQNPAQQLFAPELGEELCFIPRLLGMPEDEVQARKQDLLRFFRLEGREEEPVFHLSRGEKQRLALAGILFMKTPFLILDEPTTGLDEENKDLLFELLQGLLDEGKGILLVSHDTPFVSKFHNIHHLTMRNGRLEK